jgi:hypothetical protein
MEVKLHILNSKLEESEWSVSRSGRFIPGEGADILISFVGPKDRQDVVA